MFAGAARLAGDRAVGHDLRGVDVERAGQEDHQLVQALNLLGAGPAGVEVADQADADAVLVVILARGFAVGPVLLAGPAGADLHLAVAAAGAVADDEVVAELVPALGTVPLAEPRRVAGSGRTVVDHDALPA